VGKNGRDGDEEEKMEKYEQIRFMGRREEEKGGGRDLHVRMPS